MANTGMKPVAGLLLLLNFCMYVIVAAIGGWAINTAIDKGFIIGPSMSLPARFAPIFFPMGNAATGFFVMFAVLAGVVGAASSIAGLHHLQEWHYDTMSAAVGPAITAWSLTLLAMGLAWKEIHLKWTNSRLRTMEAFVIILSVTQLIYIAAIHGAASNRARR